MTDESKRFFDLSVGGRWMFGFSFPDGVMLQGSRIARGIVAAYKGQLGIVAITKRMKCRWNDWRNGDDADVK